MKYRVVKRMNPLNNAESKFYAAPAYMEELTVRDLAKDISDSCTLNVTDVEAVLTSLVRKLPMYLKSGFKIQLGSFGQRRIFYASFIGFCGAKIDADCGKDKTRGCAATDITSKRILFTPSSELKGEIEQASFTKA